MQYPVNNFKDKWYNSQGYGAKTSYGYHEGADLNLKTGGDSDLGQPLYAIADGVVTSVHMHTTNFGRHIHIKHDGAWGTVYSHYAHCDRITKQEDEYVKEGELIGYLGKSGTTLAHLHFAIKLEPTGIDAVAKTLEELKKWTDPIKFIEKHMVTNSPTPPMTLPKELQIYSLEWRDHALKHGLDVNDKQFSSYRTLDTKIEKKISSAVDPLKKEITRLELELSGTQSKAVADLEIAEANYKKALSDQKDALLKDQEKLIEEHKAEIEELKKLIANPPQPAKPRTGWHARWVGALDSIFGYKG